MPATSTCAPSPELAICRAELRINTATGHLEQKWAVYRQGGIGFEQPSDEWREIPLYTPPVR